MSASPSRLVALTCHPRTPCGAVSRIVVSIGRKTPEPGISAVDFEFRIDADPAALAPFGTASGRRDGLWQHTCCEAFLADELGGGYCELNFAPSGAWAAYRFSSYRSGMSAAELPQPPSIRVTRSTTGVSLSASATLSQLLPARRARVGLAAVIEEANGRLSYWSAHHPAGKPDFHHPDSFRTEI
ncbi:MAG TPA: DOMON-like domain-containing protein [Steroidobacteraceae bacterium]|nr:DOMON-like domain-containing protein [Steroidobacteraceae bacterium]